MDNSHLFLNHGLYLDEFNINTHENNSINNINEEIKEENIGNKHDYSTWVKIIRKDVLKTLREFLNDKIKYFINDIGIGIFIKQFLEIDKSKLWHSKVDYDKQFIYFKLKDIFSFDISPKIHRYPSNHNKNLVKELIKLEKEGNDFFSKFFELSFLDCLEHISGRKNIEILEGLKKIEDIFDSYKEDEDYYSYIIDKAKNYESYLNRKKARKRKRFK